MIIVGENTTSTGLTVGYEEEMHISSGGVANSTTVCDLGEIHISNGGVANDTMLDFVDVAYGDMHISSGGVANNTTLSHGHLHINDGGVANNTTVSHGDMHIFSGGVANNTMMSGGSMYISSGGTATDIIWTPCEGHVSVEDGAYVTYASQYSGVYFGSDNQLFSSAMTMDNTVVNDAMYIMSGGVANSTTVNLWGSMFISSGGVANSTTVNEWGSMFICSGGMANSITVNSSGYLTISSGGTATDIIWTPCEGYISAADGAYVTYASQYSGVYFGTHGKLFSSAMTMDDKSVGYGEYGYEECMYVMSGGVANETTMNSGGMYISSGGVANDTTVSGGWMDIFSGGVANNTTINDWGCFMDICSGGIANSTTVNSGGSMSISSGGIANDTTINDWGFMDICSGGIANSITVNSSGYLTISSGGTATNIIWTPCEGNVSVEDGAYVTYASQYSGVYFGADDQLLSSAMTMNNKKIIYYNWKMYVMSGGIANNTKTNSGGWMSISSGGIANSTTVTNFSYLGITNGGIANRTMVNSGGSMYIISGGIANSTTVNSGGWMSIFSGGVLRGSLMIKDGGKVSVNRDAVIDFTVSGRKTTDGYLINNLSRIDGEAIYTITVSDNLTAGTYKLAQGAGRFKGSITINNETEEMGQITVNGNAVIFNNIQYKLTQSRGNLLLMVNYRPCVFIYNDGEKTSSGITVTRVNLGGNDSMVVSTGGTANKTTVSSGGELTVSTGGTANKTIVSYGGVLTVSSGGIAKDTTVSAGEMYIENGGSASNTTVQMGLMEIYEGGFAKRITAVAGGSVMIYGGGTAEIATVNNGGKMWVNDGNLVSATVNNGGYMNIMSEDQKCSADKIVINKGGSVGLGGVSVKNISVKNGGKLSVGGMILHGSLNIAKGGNVFVRTDSNIIFSLEGRTEKDSCFVNDISRIQNGWYLVSLAENQTAGIYKIAGGAVGNYHTLDICSSSTEYEYSERLALGDGEFDSTMEYNGMRYTLGKNKNELYLAVSMILPDTLKVFVEKSALSYGDTTLRVVFSKESVQRAYSFDNETWYDYYAGCIDVNAHENETIYFCGTDEYGDVIDSMEYIVAESEKSQGNIYINSKYNAKTSGKKQNGELLIYGKNAFTSIEDVEDEDLSGKTFVLTDSKNSGNYADLGVVAGAPVTTTYKSIRDGWEWTEATIENVTPKNTLDITEDTGNTEFRHFSTVNVTGAVVKSVIGGKESRSDYYASSSYSRSASGKFTASNGAKIESVGYYSTVNLTGAAVGGLTGGTESYSMSESWSEGYGESTYTTRDTYNSAASGSVTLKSGAAAGMINGYSNVTLTTHSTAGDITNFTKKDSRSDTNRYIYGSTEERNIVKSTLTKTTTTTGTLKVTDAAELGNVTGFATVTLKNVINAGDFRRVDANGNSYSTIKETENATVYCGSDDRYFLDGTYTKTETFIRGGKFTATNSWVGDVENFSTVILDGTGADNVSNFLESKIVTKGTADWVEIDEFYYEPEDFELTTTETKSLNGSVTMKNDASAYTITNFKTLSMTDSTAGEITNVNKVTINKGESWFGSYMGTDGNDTLTIAKGAILTTPGGVDLGNEAKDTLALNGLLILTNEASINASKITGKGVIAAESTAYDNLENVNFANILDIGDTGENFRGIAYELADEKKAVKLEADETYDGWLGSWSGYQYGSDDVDYFKFTLADDVCYYELEIDGVAEEDWTVIGDAYDSEYGDGGCVPGGEYILMITKDSSESKSISYSVTLRTSNVSP